MTAKQVKLCSFLGLERSIKRLMAVHHCIKNKYNKIQIIEYMKYKLSDFRLSYSESLLEKDIRQMRAIGFPIEWHNLNRYYFYGEKEKIRNKYEKRKVIYWEFNDFELTDVLKNFD